MSTHTYTHTQTRRTIDFKIGIIMLLALLKFGKRTSYKEILCPSEGNDVFLVNGVVHPGTTQLCTMLIASQDLLRI